MTRILWMFRYVLGRYRQDTPTSPLSAGADKLDIAIYQTDQLTDRNGRAPEQTVGRFLHEALFEYGHRITFDYPTITMPSNQTHGDGNLRHWRSTAKDYDARDANLLLMDSGGGGIAYLRGRYGLGPAKHITRLLPYLSVGYGDAYKNTRACLHEIGHMFGGKHSDKMIPRPRMDYSDTFQDDLREYYNARY